MVVNVDIKVEIETQENMQEAEIVLLGGAEAAGRISVVENKGVLLIKSKLSSKRYDKKDAFSPKPSGIVIRIHKKIDVRIVNAFCEVIVGDIEGKLEVSAIFEENCVYAEKVRDADIFASCGAIVTVADICGKAVLSASYDGKIKVAGAKQIGELKADAVDNGSVEFKGTAQACSLNACSYGSIVYRAIIPEGDGARSRTAERAGINASDKGEIFFIGEVEYAKVEASSDAWVEIKKVTKEIIEENDGAEIYVGQRPKR